MLPLVRVSLLAVSVLLLAGCTPSGNTGPARTAQPIPSPTSSAAASAPPKPADTCENIVTPAALTKLTTPPNAFVPDFTNRMRVPGSQLYRFIELGGIACEWGRPNSDIVYDLASSAITDAQASVEKATLVGLGWVASPLPAGGELFTNPQDDLYKPVYAFSTGRWRYALLETDLELFA
jgi:hypothetical protein